MGNKVKMRCPTCGKRVFDLSQLPRDPIIVATKCPQCKSFVDVPCTSDWTITAKATPTQGKWSKVTSK